MAYRGLKVFVFTLSILVHLNISQTQTPEKDICSNGEECLEVDNCVNGKVLLESLTYTTCSVRNYVPGICCKKATTTEKPAPTRKPPPSWKRPTTRKPLTTSKPPTTTSQPRNPKNSTAIVLENCKKYAEYRYVNKSMDNPIPGLMPKIYYRETNCVTEKPLIANGRKASPKEYPHMALMGYADRNRFSNNDVEWDCGGSLISEKFVLSAAHCSRHNRFGAPKWALLGDLNIKSDVDDAKPAVYSIVSINDHPNYNSETKDNDITLYQLNTTVELSPYVRPACLYTTASKPVRTVGIITGWGRTGSANIRIVEDSLCINKSDNYNTTNEICAGDIKEGRDTCVGDSGGPLQVSSKETCMWDIIGVTSYGPGICGNYEEYSVYNYVAVHLDWIQQIVWP